VQVKISARHGHLSEEHQAELREKAEKLLHFFERLTFIEVTADLQKDEKVVEVVASAEHKHEFVAKVADADVMVAMTGAVEKVKHQITHYKDRIQDHRGNPSASGAGHRP
jgi:putative sigma-54 modulation protein